MGFNWGFTLKNKEKNITLPLMDFCGWNSQTLYDAVRCFGDKEKEDESVYKIIDLDGLLNWLDKVKEINTIFAGISARRIEEDDFPDEVFSKFYDLCYDLDVERDTFNIYALMRLATLGRMFREGELLRKNSWSHAWDGWDLYVDGSY